MAPTFSYRLKLERARVHIRELEQAVKEWLATDAFTIPSETDPDTRITTRRARITEPPPERLAIIAGDALHNLRTALDHIVYALAAKHLGTAMSPSIEANLTFPIIGNETSLGRREAGSTLYANAVGRGALNGLPSDALTFIEQEQPFKRTHSPDDHRWNPLWVLNELERIDKHRRINVVTAALNAPFVVSPGPKPKGITFYMDEGPVKHDDKLVSYPADGGFAAHFHRGVAFGEVAKGDHIVGTLATIEQKVSWIVLSLERYL